MQLRFYDIIAIIAACALIASCSATRYPMSSLPTRLDTTCHPMLTGTVSMAVEEFRPAVALDNTTFQLYDPRTREITYEKCYRWDNTPLRLINNVILQTLTNAPPFSTTVKVVPAGNKATFVMTGEIISMRIESIDDDPERAVVSFHVRVVRSGAGAPAAPIIDGTYRGEGAVAEQCLEKIPAAMDMAISNALDSLLRDLCREMKDLPTPVRDVHFVTTPEPCIRICSFRLEADSITKENPGRKKIRMTIFDREKEVVEHIDMEEVTAVSNGASFTATTAGVIPNLTITIDFPQRGKKTFMRISGLLRGPVELLVTAESVAAVKKWMKGEHMPGKVQ